MLRFQREEHRDADVGRMSVGELVGKVLADEHADVLRQAVVWLAQELMEAEVSQAAGAAYGERSGERVTRRNGYRERAWDTRVGSLELAIPKLRQGSYFPSFLEPRRRSEQALVAVVQVDRLVEALGLAGVSKDQVSRLCGGLDEQVQAFRERPLEGAYPYLWLDAKVEKVRAGGRVEHRALVVAYGVDAAGQREVIGLDVGAAETEAFWREFLALAGPSRPGRGAAGGLRRPRGPQATRASGKRSPRCWVRPGSAARSTSCVMPWGTVPRICNSWSAPRSARSSAPPRSRRPGDCWARR